MSTALSALLIFIGVGIGVWLFSFVMEALRPAPREPQRLRWAPDLPVEHVDVGGNTFRYIKTGKGPGTVEGFLDRLDLRDVTLAGVSIGGLIALIVAARRNPRVLRVVAINPYDYAKGRGMARSSLFGGIVTYASLLPVIGETVMRLRNFLIMRAVLNGGVADPNSIPPALLKEMYLVGNRPGHHRAFLSLLRNAETWETAKDCGRIEVPVLLVWGDRDWARAPEREHDRSLIPGVQMTTLERGGHFLPLDRPAELSQLITRFAGA
jgi:pimeloyl-ACP methyl ester carboxylesterase